MASETIEKRKLFQHFAKIEMSEEIEKLKEEIKLMNEDRINLESLLEDELPDYSQKDELHVKKDIFKLEHKLRKLRKKYPALFAGENSIDVEEEKECCSLSDNVPCEWHCARLTCQTLNGSEEMSNVEKETFKVRRRDCTPVIIGVLLERLRCKSCALPSLFIGADEQKRCSCQRCFQDRFVMNLTIKPASEDDDWLIIKRSDRSDTF